VLPTLPSVSFESRDPDFEQKVRRSFLQQGLMATLGAQLVDVRPGLVEITATANPGLTQQDGFLHAGVVIAVLDTACGYAAHSLMAPNRRVLTVELKVNLLAPADGNQLNATGEVLRPGRTLTVCRGEAHVDGRHIATVLTTMIAIEERTGA
jgi:uncharacterized protein (TIGR00369 family)